MSQTEHYAVIGLGITGLSCVRYLARLGKTMSVFDTRDNPPGLSDFQKDFPSISVHLGELQTDLLATATHLVVSPGISIKTEAIKVQLDAGKAILGDIELFAQAVNVPVIAITGTNAKSTVTTMVGEMAQAAGLRVQVAGNIGVPVLDRLQEDMPDVFVLELSSFQLETTYSLAASVASVLNVTPDHLDRYADFAAYQAAKLRIYQNAKKIVVNRDDDLTQIPHAKSTSFGTSAPVSGEFGFRAQQGQPYLAFGDRLLMPVKDLPQSGRHDHINALAALAIGHAFGLPLEPMLMVLKTFQGLPHRCQLVRERAGVRWFNDSKGTNVGATLAAIEGLGQSQASKNIILIAGGVGKGADFSPLASTVSRYVKHVVLIGEAAQGLYQALNAHAPCSLASSLEEAIQQCEQAASPGDHVLLSPACASFDMFKSYAHRGEVFTDIVQGL